MYNVIRHGFLPSRFLLCGNFIIPSGNRPCLFYFVFAKYIIRYHDTTSLIVEQTLVTCDVYQYIQILWTLDFVPVVQLRQGMYCHNFIWIIYQLNVPGNRSGFHSSYFNQVYEDKYLWSVTVSYTRKGNFMIYVGIGIIKLNHFASALSSDGGILLQSFSFTNSYDGFCKL